MSEAPEFMKEAVKAQPRPAPTEDALKALRAKLAATRDDIMELQDVEAKAKDIKARITKAKTQELPDTMEELGLTSLGLEAEGNLPAFQVVSKPFYNANIAADWPVEKRLGAFNYLEDENAGDLIKTEVTVAFNRDQRDEAKALIQRLRDEGLDVQVKQGVHPQTLTAWLREMVETHKRVPTLDIIGGFIGRVVDLKPVKVK